MTLTAEPRGPGNGCYMQRGNRLEWWRDTGRVYEYGGRRYRVYQRGAETCPVEVCAAAAATLAENWRRAQAVLCGDGAVQLALWEPDAAPDEAAGT